MNKPRNPATISPPIGNYVHAMETPANARWLTISGQVGILPDGKTAQGIEAQAAAAWHNIAAILADAGMSPADLVKVTTYVTRAEHAPAARAARDKVIAGHKPASTLVIIAGLASPDWLIEVEATAAKA